MSVQSPRWPGWWNAVGIGSCLAVDCVGVNANGGSGMVGMRPKYAVAAKNATCLGPLPSSLGDKAGAGYSRTMLGWGGAKESGLGPSGEV